MEACASVLYSIYFDSHLLICWLIYMWSFNFYTQKPQKDKQDTWHTDTHTQRHRPPPPNTHTHTLSHMHAHTHSCMHAHTHTRAHTLRCIHTRAHTHTSTHTHTQLRERERERTWCIVYIYIYFVCVQLEDVMEKETYKKAREILEKFDPARFKKLEVSPAFLRTEHWASCDVSADNVTLWCYSSSLLQCPASVLWRLTLSGYVYVCVCVHPCVRASMCVCIPSVWGWGGRGGHFQCHASDWCIWPVTVSVGLVSVYHFRHLTDVTTVWKMSGAITVLVMDF